MGREIASMALGWRLPKLVVQLGATDSPAVRTPSMLRGMPKVMGVGWLSLLCMVAFKVSGKGDVAKGSVALAAIQDVPHDTYVSVRISVRLRAAEYPKREP